jgi:Tol biopolymer transport system component
MGKAAISSSRASALALAFAFALGCFVLTQSANAAFPGANGKIAYADQHPGELGDGEEITVVNPDGTGRTLLTTSNGRDLEPDWKADGTRIAFQSDRWDPFSQDFELFVMNADGSSDTRLTTFIDTPFAQRGAESPSWSPDGTRIAFDEGQKYGNPDLWVMNSDGTGQTKLTNDGHYNRWAAWSPKGDRIAFTKLANEDNTGIHTIRPDGSDARLIAPGIFWESDWSPDGTQLVFAQGTPPGDLFVVNADGTGLRNLTASDPYAALSPIWSPDGAKIAFERITPTSTDIVVMDADGRNDRAVVDRPGFTPSLGSWQAIPGPRRADYKNAAKFCAAERDFFGEDTFVRRYGGGANAFGRCVSSS